MASEESREETPIKQPPSVDPGWREKIEKANQAREMGRQLREGKESSFRPAVGRAQAR